MGFTYLFGGLRLRSEVGFPELRAVNEGYGDGLPLVTISLGLEMAPEPDRQLFAWSGRYGMSLWDRGGDWLFRSKSFGDVLVSRDGRSARCFPSAGQAGPGRAAPGGMGDGLRDLFVKRILPRIALLRGRLAIHAAALAQPQGGLLLLGLSGAGKSTLAAFLAHDGWSLLSDDASLIDPAAGSMLPAARGVCLWPESRRALGLPAEQCRPLPLFEGKTWFEPLEAPTLVPPPLRGFIFLERSAEVAAPRLVALSSVDVLVGATHQLVRFSPPDRQACGGLVGPLNSVTRRCFGYRLVYPASYEALPEVAAALSGLVTQRAAA